MSQQWKIEGKTFLVTGAASGLGAQYVEAFVREGAKNAAILDVDEKTGRATVERLSKKYNTNLIFIKCDVSDEDNLTQAFNEVVNEFGQVDVIINNAGLMTDAPGAWTKACNVNWEGLISLTMKGIKHMRKDEGGAGGTIINISSTGALTIWPMLPIYSGTKLAVLHFTKCLALDPFYEETGIRAMTLCPGPTDTALLQRVEERTYTKALGETFASFMKGQRYQKPDIVVATCVEMFKKGNNGSVWLGADEKPPKDITKAIEDAFDIINKAVQA